MLRLAGVEEPQMSSKPGMVSPIHRAAKRRSSQKTQTAATVIRAVHNR